MSTKVLVVDDKQMMRDSVGATLQRAGYVVVVASSGEDALAKAKKHRPAVVVTDLQMPGMSGLELLTELRGFDAELPVVLMTAYGTVADAVRAMHDGAFDFVQKPFEGDQLVMVVRRAVENRRLRKENDALRSERAPRDAGPELVGDSPAMQALTQQVKQVAASSGTVLIHGESGTGKEVVARAVHAHSPRHDKIMLCLNCAALSSSLLESELFGHEKGAFTGAEQLRKGRFELADGGTLLLDEISEISPQLQAKLLRVLQEGQFERVGSSATMKVDVRVIATTNRDLSRSVADGTFRQDLYYRLNVLPLALPSLHERSADVPQLASHFLAQAARREGREAKRFDAQAVALLQAYRWPGNVRELQNICERASVLCPDRVISAALIRPWLPAAGMTPAAPADKPQTEAFSPRFAMGSPPLQPPAVGAAGALASPYDNAVAAPPAPSIRPLEEIEREQVLHVLGQFSGNRTRAAQALGIGVRTLGLKLKKWKEQNLVAASV
ncbi:MAG: sigma 54-interacting transcriptional regulator [Phycisphaerales bacterium JB063]